MCRTQSLLICHAFDLFAPSSYTMLAGHRLAVRGGNRRIHESLARAVVVAMDFQRNSGDGEGDGEG